MLEWRTCPALPIVTYQVMESMYRGFLLHRWHKHICFYPWPEGYVPGWRDRFDLDGLQHKDCKERDRRVNLSWPYIFCASLGDEQAVMTAIDTLWTLAEQEVST